MRLLRSRRGGASLRLRSLPRWNFDWGLRAEALLRMPLLIRAKPAMFDRAQLICRNNNPQYCDVVIRFLDVEIMIRLRPAVACYRIVR